MLSELIQVYFFIIVIIEFFKYKLALLFTEL